MSDGKTILLVEDNAVVRLAESQALELLGYAVISAGSGDQAVSTVHATPGIDLILMDIDLGKGIDGTEAARAIQADNDLPIVFLSLHDEKYVVDKTENITSYGYVVKGSGAAVIDASIKMALKLHKAHRELKENERMLRVSEARLRKAQAIAHVGHWTIDLASHRVWASEEAFRIYGIERVTAEVPLDAVQQCVLPRYRRPLDEALQRLIKQQGPYDEEFQVKRCNDGEVRSIHSKGELVLAEDGTPASVEGVLQDITDRKKIEEALRESEERFRLFLDHNPIYVFFKDENVRTMQLSKNFETMLGMPMSQLIGKTMNELFPSEIAAKMVDDDLKVLQGGVAIEVEEELDGRFFRTIKFPILREGRPSFLAGFSMDITDRKKAEEEKARLQSQLFRAQKMEAIGTLTGGIAHDFNNILTALVGYAGLLQMRIAEGDLRSYVDQILSASHKAADLIQSLLAFSKQQHIAPCPISINGIIKGTGTLLKRLVTEDITIKTRLAADDITIMADATQIDQILFNLVSNARDAMPRGGTLAIETRSVELDDDFQSFHGYGAPGQFALLSVSDTGVGMDAATRDRIFDPFFTTKEVGKGTGLGLSTVYGIVKQHGGYIAVYSEPGVGTTFNIYLPVAAKKAAGEVKSAPKPIERGNETILIAEDNDAVRGLMKEVLTEYGYTIIVAVDGEDAINQYEREPKIDLLILDSIMPKKNGRAVYDELRRIKPDIKVLFTSGYTKDIFLDKGIEDREFDFVSKPVSPHTLLQKVREVLDRHGSS